MQKFLSDYGAIFVMVDLIAHDRFGSQHICPQSSNLAAKFAHSVVHAIYSTRSASKGGRSGVAAQLVPTSICS
jgi:hypothetical protein